MKTKVLAAPGAVIEIGVGRPDAALILKAVERHADVFLSARRPVTAIRGEWHYLLVSSTPRFEVAVRIRDDMYPDVEIHEWATPNAVVHFLLTGIPDRRYAAQALILHIFAP